MEIKPDLNPETFHKLNHMTDSSSSLNPSNQPETEPKQQLNLHEKDIIPSLEQLSTKQKENKKASQANGNQYQELIIQTCQDWRYETICETVDAHLNF